MFFAGSFTRSRARSTASTIEPALMHCFVQIGRRTHDLDRDTGPSIGFGLVGLESVVGESNSFEHGSQCPIYGDLMERVATASALASAFRPLPAA